ncbi:MAG: FFLEELY motif protein [Inhella sp.]
MTDPASQIILDSLDAVARDRARRASEGLEPRCTALKQFQQQRFRLAYADLLASPRYAGAAGFFLDELYGPRDFTQRDAQFQRIVKPLVRLFPAEVVDTVAQLARLHALSERLDTRMTLQLGDQFQPADYIRAWQAVGDEEGRAQQIRLTLAVGRALDVYTRKPLLRGMLLMMRKPAAIAGLSELQQFLECGFDTFKTMRGAGEFLETIRHREEVWAATLFAGDPDGRFTALWV